MTCRVASLAMAALLCACAGSFAASAHTPSMFAATRGEIVDAALQLLATMPEQPGDVERLYGISQRKLALRPFDDPDRADWSYWPRKRSGVAIEDLSAQQRRLLHRLLDTILSASGHLQLVQIMQLEEVLHSLEKDGFERNAEKYHLTFFGMPSPDRPWALRFEGHHVSVNLTLASSLRFSATPLFLGAAPATIESGPLAGFRALGAEEDLALELVRSFNAAEAAEAIGPEAPGDILSTQFQIKVEAWDRWSKEIAAEGVSWASLDASQRTLVERLLAHITRRYRPEIASAYLKLIDRKTLRFLWLGATQLRRPHYFRITTGDFVYEFDNSQGNANHIHTVWRDRRNDLGADALAEHYRKAHRGASAKRHQPADGEK